MNTPISIINASAPVRICDIGGWTDTWFAVHGRVLNIAVGPRVEAQVFVYDRDARDAQITVFAENFDDRFSVDPDNLMLKGKHALLEAAFSLMHVPDNVAVDVHLFSDIPAGASMGTSAAVSVALIGALDLITPGRLSDHEVAETAHRIETDILGWQCGIQDQLCAAHGGVCSIRMQRYPTADVSGLDLAPDIRWELERRLAVVYLGSAHVSSRIHEQVIRELEETGEHDPRLAELRRLAEQAEHALTAGNFDAFAELMRRNTEVQRTLHPGIVGVTAQQVIDIAAEAGAVGWKLNGAGGEGGSVTLLFGAENRAHRRFVADLSQALPAARRLAVHLTETGLRRWVQHAHCN